MRYMKPKVLDDTNAIACGFYAIREAFFLENMAMRFETRKLQITKTKTTLFCYIFSTSVRSIRLDNSSGSLAMSCIVISLLVYVIYP